MRTPLKKLSWCSAVLGLALAIIALPKPASAQDQDQDDPPGRVARLGYMEGSVSFQPAGEDDWVGAVPNRPMTTGDKLWTDVDSRAEVQLGSAVIRLAPMTGFSFLNLDDNTMQIQLTSGMINITVRRLNDDDDFEVDTPNLAFTAFQPGHYRIEASEDGNTTTISVRAGDGEATGYGQSYSLRGGQVGYFSGTDSLYADVEEIGYPDAFDTWAEGRDHRFDYSRSARYLAPDVVGFDDLDDYGDWRDDSNYGHVWFPSRVDAGWAPYHEGHWDWISPWGWTWVDDSSWGYAPFHYGRWVSVGGRWGWVAGPVAVRAVYAPALVVFIGGGPGGWGGNVGWFPLGPREVYVPSYHVSEAYVNRVNISNTTVNITQVTNVYHTTIINNTTTNITNITYANRSVQGAVMVVPQHAFTSAQPVAQARVQVSAQQIASAPLSGRVAVAPTRESVLGAKASTGGHVTAPPAAVANRQVVAKKTPPPPPVPFAKQQQALAAHPGEPVARSQLQTLRPAAAVHPMVKVAPPAKPATPTTGHPGNAARPGQPAATPPANRPGTPPAANERPAEPNRPAATQPTNRPETAQPANRPSASQPINRPPTPPANRPETTPTRPETNRPPAAEPNKPAPTPPANRTEPTPPRPEASHPPAAQPNKPAPTPPANRPAATPNRPETNRPPAETARPTPPPARNDRPPAAQPAPRQTPPAAERPAERTPPPAAAKPAPAPPKQQPKPQTPEEKKKQQEEEKKPQ